MKEQSPEKQLAGFIVKYTPEVAAVAHAALEKMRARLPGAVELVYDNYNALAIGFAPSERTSDAIFSIAVYPRWVSLFFLHGAGLSDPQKLLKGSGKVVRHIVLKDATTLDDPGVQALIAQTLGKEHVKFDGQAPGRIIIKSISAKQRSRRPA